MTKADWLEIAPAAITSVVTLLVAFGVWLLTSRSERRRLETSNERDELVRRLDTYSRLYGSLYVWPNAARDAFTDPTDRRAVDIYEAAMKDVAIEYGHVLMIGRLESIGPLQHVLGPTIDRLDGLLARRRAEGTVLLPDDAAHDPRGAEFLKAKRWCSTRGPSC